MELIQSKSLLAKLMATENLTVEQRNVQTAAFNVKDRILVVPVLDKKISGYLYDLFMGHEVGHALYTPLEGMQKARDEKISMSIMNVLEDVRIERKIKYKYPGLRSSFVRGYRELIEKDFFGTEGTDLNDMNFIDRVNLHTKGGAAQGIKFNDFEQSLLTKIEGTETYDDVIEVARLVCEYMKEQEEERKSETEIEFDGEIEIESAIMESDYDFDNESYESDEKVESGSGDGDEESDIEFEEEGDSENGEDSHGESKQVNGGPGVSGNQSEEEELKSYTDESYRDNEKKLFSKDPDSYYYGNIPDVDLSKAIISHKVLWSRYRESASNMINEGIDTKNYLKLRNDSKKVVGYLAKEFELRKNADQLKRASVAKTGDLNMSKIYSYQFAEDLFKKITVVPGAKSHGLVMFLDWSGSMTNHMTNTVKQLINLIMFCKKVNIPYEVYAFTQEYDKLYKPTEKIGDIPLKNFALMNLLSSKMTSSELTYAASALVNMAKPRQWKPRFMCQGGTPLNQAIISAMKIIPHFQKQYKLQIVNTIFLTDGEGDVTNGVYYKGLYGSVVSGHTNDCREDHSKEKTFVIRDNVTKTQEIVHRYGCREHTEAYIKLLKARTNCNIIGFYVLSGRELGRVLYHFYPNNFHVHDKIKSDFRKSKSITVTNAGFDEYYLLRSEGLDTDDDVEFEVKENATTRGLVSAFSKYTGNRLNNRVVLNRFIGLIS
jgi:hypothetical protein